MAPLTGATAAGGPSGMCYSRWWSLWRVPQPLVVPVGVSPPVGGTAGGRETHQRHPWRAQHLLAMQLAGASPVSSAAGWCAAASSTLAGAGGPVTEPASGSVFADRPVREPASGS